MTVNPKEELKNCPFCGYLPHIQYHKSTDSWSVSCQDNKPFGHSCLIGGAESRSHAIYNWNKRTGGKE